MLTNQLRPFEWADVVGQKESVKILNAIVKNPEDSPKSLIFTGDFGSGKTSSARILARKLNNITDPNYNLNGSPFYTEYDSSIIGNVEEIKKLKDTFGSSFGDSWNVIVFDEVHVASQQAQTALLKTIEEVVGKTFYIFATTHVHKLLPTIRSRSLELQFTTVSYVNVIEHLKNLETQLGLVISDDVKDLIAVRSDGHMRNVHMLVDKFKLIGEGDFKATVLSGKALLCDFLTAAYEDDGDKAMKIINDILQIPITEFKSDMMNFVAITSKALYEKSIEDSNIEKVIKLFGNDIMKATSSILARYMWPAFNSEYHLQSALVVLYTSLRRELPKKSNTTVDRTSMILRR